MATNPQSVKITSEGDSLFGKIAHFVEEVGEHIAVDVETEIGKIRRFFHKDHVEVIPAVASTKVTVAEVSASTKALPSAPVAPVEAEVPTENPPVKDVTPAAAPVAGATDTPPAAASQS